VGGWVGVRWVCRCVVGGYVCVQWVCRCGMVITSEHTAPVGAHFHVRGNRVRCVCGGRGGGGGGKMGTGRFGSAIMGCQQRTDRMYGRCPIDTVLVVPSPVRHPPCTQGGAPVHLGQPAQPREALEPHPVPVHKGDHGDGHLEQALAQRRDAVIRLLRLLGGQRQGGQGGGGGGWGRGVRV
jgi:hypothetical protein